MEKIMTQYIELTKELYFDETAGKFIGLRKGSYGFVLNEKGIECLQGANEAVKAALQANNKRAIERGNIYALVEGYPCELREEEYKVLKKIPHRCIGELL